MPDKDPLLKKIEDYLRRWFFRGKSEPPGDPYADKFAPVRRGPKGRSGAAVAEPEEETNSFFPPRRQ